MVSPESTQPAGLRRSRLGSLAARALPWGWRDFFLQAVIFWTFNLAYEGSRGIADGRKATAITNGERVIDAERTLGIFWEHGLQNWVLSAPAVFERVANETYFNCQFTISFGFLLWVYFFRNHAFYFARNVIVSADFIGLFGYLTFPTAPPRLIPAGGFVDTTLKDSTISHQSWIVKTFANEYAAMPSLHTAYALTIGTTAVLVCRSIAAKILWTFYPALVVYSIISTGNHFILDAVAGAFVAQLAFLLAFAATRGILPRRGRPPAGPLTPSARAG
jgi:membrane-associated phospholipid phosphatase